MDPTAEDIETFRCLGDVAAWAAMETPIADSMFACVGTNRDAHVRLIGAMGALDFELGLVTWNVPLGEQNTPTPPLPVHKVQAKLFARACRVAVGAELTLEQVRQEENRRREEQQAQVQAQILAMQQVTEQAKLAAEAAALAAAAPKDDKTSTGHVELKDFVLQTSTHVVKRIEQADIDKHYTAYVRIRGRRPTPAEECTAEQLTALFALIKSKGSIYVDLALFGPHRGRLDKNFCARGYGFRMDGAVHWDEVKGPPTYEDWEACMLVLRTGFIGFEVVSIGLIDDHVEKIKKIAMRYEPRFWCLLYQAEVRFRKEHLDRIRRDTDDTLAGIVNAMAPDGREGPETEVAEASRHLTLTFQQAVAIPGYNPESPWEYCWRKGLSDTEWWNEQFHEPAKLMRDHLISIGEVVKGDAAVAAPGDLTAAKGRDDYQVRGHAGTASSQLPQPVRLPTVPVLPDGWTVPPPPKRPRVRGREHSVSEGLYTTNRAGIQLCHEWQKGTCTETKAPNKCPHGPRVHQCAKCLSDQHGADACQATPRAPSQNGKSGGKKGKGKGKKGGKSRGYQY